MAYSPGIRSGTRPFLYVRQHGSIAAYLHGLDLELQRSSRDIAVSVANVYLKYLQKYTPVGNARDPRRPNGDGALKKGWFLLVLGGSLSATRILILNKESYLKWVVRGRAAIDQTTKPPGRRWPLHFFINGREFYRWRVAATRPNDFVRQAIIAARPAATRAATEEVKRVIQRASAR